MDYNEMLQGLVAAVYREKGKKVAGAVELATDVILTVAADSNRFDGKTTEQVFTKMAEAMNDAISCIL